jgi:hypothetical protein
MVPRQVYYGTAFHAVLGKLIQNVEMDTRHEDITRNEA